MACQEWSGKLDTYLDGELSVDETRSIDAHLRTCQACAADALARVQMKRTVQMAGRRFSPSAEFRRQISKKARQRGFRLVWAWALVPVLLLAMWGMTYVGQERRARAHLFSEVADLHVSALASGNPVDVVSSDRHTVKPWFEGKIPFTFNLPELQSSEFTLLGGRITYLDQVAGAQLIYQIRKHRISVFIFPERALAGKLPGDSGLERQLSFNQQTWSEGELRYFLIADAPAPDISQLRKLLRDAAKQ